MEVVHSIGRGVAPHKTSPLCDASIGAKAHMVLLDNQVGLYRPPGIQHANISPGSLRSREDEGTRTTPVGESTRHSVEEPGLS